METGRVHFYNLDKGFGFIIVDAGGPDVRFDAASGPFKLVEGTDQPEMSECPDKMNGSARRGDRVIFMRKANDQTRVAAWTFEAQVTIVQAVIDRRTQFQVIRTNILNGKPNSTREVFFQGSIEQLTHYHPREGVRVSRKDKLAPTYVAGAVVATHKFEQEVRTGKWIPCADPRPFPTGSVFRIMRVRKASKASPERTQTIAIGTAEKIQWEFPLGSDKDPIKGLVNSDLDCVVFDRLDQPGTPRVVVTEDPRKKIADAMPKFDGIRPPQQAPVSATPAPARQATPVAGPKPGHPRKNQQFKTTLRGTGFEALGELHHVADKPVATASDDKKS